MNPFLPLKKKTGKFLFVTIFGLVCLSAKSQSFPYLSFTGATLQSGTALQQGSVYKFTNVASGVDAFVTIQGLYNGATVTNIDQFSGVGYDGGFQPIVNSTVTGTNNSFARFYIEFKKTDGTSYTFSNLAVTSLDIDGTTLTCREFCAINMNGGNAVYQSTTPEISVTQNGTTFTATNISGNNISGIDSTHKEVMFTVQKSSVSSFTIDYGTIYTSGGGVRNMAAFFKNFEYPLAKALPVKLISFNAMLNNNKVDLKWTTASEINVSHFAVERSFDGINFNDAAIVFAFGNTTQKMDYNYSDNISSVQSSVIYYRLRSVDIDGKFEYSEVRIIRISKQVDNNITITAYPNPVTNQVNVTIPNNWQNKKVVFEIFNANGQVSKRSENNSGSQTETINVSNLASGFYVVRVSCDGETAQQKIIKK